MSGIFLFLEKVISYVIKTEKKWREDDKKIICGTFEGIIPLSATSSNKLKILIFNLLLLVTLNGRLVN